MPVGPRWYRNRWVRSGTVAAALGEERPAGPVHNDMDFAPNTNVIGHHGTTLAIVEAGALPYELGYELDTIGSTDLAGGLDAGYTAHPKVDPATGELHAVSYFWGWGNQVQYTVIDTAGKVVTKRMVETTGSPMLHDMSLTERYAVVYDLPVVFDLDAAMAGAAMPYFWQDDYPARLGLIDRTDVDGPVRWLDVDPCYVFHPMNAFDDGDDVVIDVVRWDGMFRKGHQGPFESGQHSSLRRWTLDVAGGKVREDVIDERPQEFPRVDERVVGRRHRYGYAATIGGVTKHDLDRGTQETLDFGTVVRPERSGVRARSRRGGRGRRLAAVPHLRRRPGHQRPHHHPRAGPGRRPGGDRPPRPPGPLRVPRQLGARRLIWRSDR